MNAYNICVTLLCIAVIIGILGVFAATRQLKDPKRAGIIYSRVVCAANKYADGTIVLGARHFDQHMHARLRERRPGGGEEQGFIDSHGNFLTRHEAWVIAETAGQIVRRCGGDGPERFGLFSENLY